MIKTMNYQLNQWEPTDEVRREDFNSDNAAIDAAIKAVADTANSKAGTAEVSALSQTVSALTTALGSGGQTCRIAWGSYTGNGKYGSANPTKLTFPFQPRLVFIATNSGGSFAYSLLGYPVTSGTSIGFSSILNVTWGDKMVSWYTTATSNQSLAQNNTSGYVYYYFALGCSE